MNGPQRALFCGAATGGRTFTGLAALALATPADSDRQPDATLRRPWVRAGLSLLAAQEDVMDKLPRTPSRLQPPGLILRGVAAAGAGFIIAERTRTPRAPVLTIVPTDTPAARHAIDRATDGAADADSGSPRRAPDPATSTSAPDPRIHTATCVTLCVGSALVSCWAGARWRAWAAPRLHGDYAGAGIEDAAVTALAWLGAR